MSEPPIKADQEASDRIGAAAHELDSALSLSGLGLPRLPEDLRALKYLTVLDLSGNLLTELPEWIGELAALEQLVLRGNRLTQLPPSLARLSRLTQLDAADNRLLQVAPELAALPRLATIELRGNPHLLVPPPEVVAQGGRAVLEHLRGTAGPAEAATEIIFRTPPRPPIQVPADAGHGTRRKALMIGVPVLVVCVAVAITAALSSGRAGQTSTSALPAARAVTSVNGVVLPPGRTATNGAVTLHAPTYSPTSTAGRTATHAASPQTSATSGKTTAAAAGPPAAPTTAYPTAAPGVDLAANGPAASSSTMQNYAAANVVDGNPNTYWESLDGAALPQTLKVDLGEVTTVGRFDFRLPPASDWNERTETFTILGSTNGTDFFTIEPSGTYTFNANSAADDSASLTVAPVHTRYIELYFTATNGWPAAQLGELDVYS
jgi:F5/8 type C domain/Leucine rich repeat